MAVSERVPLQEARGSHRDRAEFQVLYHLGLLTLLGHSLTQLWLPPCVCFSASSSKARHDLKIDGILSGTAGRTSFVREHCPSNHLLCTCLNMRGGALAFVS